MVNPVGIRERETGLPSIDFAPIQEARGWFIGLGVAFMLLGLAAALLPLTASVVTTLTLGWLMVAGGVVQGVHAIQNRRWGGAGWALAGALLYVVAGILVVVYPITGTLVLTLVLAGFFLVQGALKMIRAVQHRSMSGWGWLLFDGLLALALGLFIGIGWPSTAAWALGLLVGIDFLFGGLSLLLIGLRAGSARHRVPA